MQRKELGIAVIGSGRIGTLRATLASAHPAVRFIAVSDRDPARDSERGRRPCGTGDYRCNRAVPAHP